MEKDAVVESSGTIYTIRPITDAAKEWINENVASDGMWFGNALCVEHRYSADIVAGMEDAGLVVEWW